MTLYGKISPHGTRDSHARQAAPDVVNVLSTEDADLFHEVNSSLETLAQTQSALTGMQTRLQVLQQQQPQMKGQLDVLIAFQIS